MHPGAGRVDRPADTNRASRCALLRVRSAAETELCRLRLRVERIESDVRIGGSEAPEYTRLKGSDLPQAESRVVELFRDLLKLEDKINAERARQR